METTVNFPRSENRKLVLSKQTLMRLDGWSPEGPVASLSLFPGLPCVPTVTCSCRCTIICFTDTCLQNCETGSTCTCI